MNETLALTKYAWTRYRLYLTILMATIIGSFLLGLALHYLAAPMWSIRAVAGTAYLAILASLLGSVAWFGFSRTSGLFDTAGGYDPWLLRMPIPNWKLAMIPVGMITLWNSTIWITIALIVRLLGGPSLPTVSQALGISTSAIIACSLVWKPQRAVWNGVALLIVTLPALYVLSIGAVAVFMDFPQWLPLTFVGIVLAYVAAIGMALHSVNQARISRFQQARQPLALFDRGHAADVTQVSTTRHSFSQWSEALNWHDQRRARQNSTAILVTSVLLLLFIVTVLPVSAATAIFSLTFLAGYVGFILSVRIEPTVWGVHGSLPSYLATSPIPSRQMAYVRLRAIATGYASLVLLFSLLWLINFGWAENRETLSRWWISTTAASTTSASPLRMIVAIYLGVFITTLGISLRIACVQFTGRATLTVATLTLSLVIICTPLFVFLGWFMRQREWEQVIATMQSLKVWTYYLLYIGIAIKLAVHLSLTRIAARQLFSWREIVMAIIRWTAGVLAGAALWYTVWPLSNVNIVTVVMAAMLAIPLSPYFAGPLAVQVNRHRRVPT